jgi:hypothetical protein
MRYSKFAVPPAVAIALFATVLAPLTVRGQIFVTDQYTGTVGEYGLDGTTINPALISDLIDASGITASGSDVFATRDNYTVNEYTTSGAVVAAPFVTSLGLPPGSPPSAPYALAVSGSNLYIANLSASSVGEYTTSGAVVNASLITGLGGVQSIAASGSDLFVPANDAVGEYTLAGAPVNTSLIAPGATTGIAISGSNLFITNGDAGTISEFTLGATPGTIASSIPSLITGLHRPVGITTFGSDLFVTNEGNGMPAGSGTVGEYTLSGAVVNADLITGLDEPYGIVVVPEPATGAIAVVAGLALLARRPRRRVG